MPENSTSASSFIEKWMQSRGWIPRDFQQRVWAAQRQGKSGMVTLETGAGKTYAVYGGLLERVFSSEPGQLRLLYISPLRAMTRDIEKALQSPLSARELEPPRQIRIESRTGDTPAAVRRRQQKQLPEVLLTTPESLSLLLSYPEAQRLFSNLIAVIVDEWHELLPSKRGAQTELALARLRSWNPKIQTWGLSATLAEPHKALRYLCPNPDAEIISGTSDLEVEVKTLLPSSIKAIPWAGNIGLHMLPKVIQAIDPTQTTLLFVNTRAQAELWINGLLGGKPEWRSILAVHHGSMEREAREKVEAGLKSGSLKIVIATSSLDLGVDFSPVEAIFQIGSPKGIARLFQRAGRAKHRPGSRSVTLTCVPTHAIQMAEFSAARDAMANREIEPLEILDGPVDVLWQHLLTAGLSEPFKIRNLLDELRSAFRFRNLTLEQLEWSVHYLSTGGKTLRAYDHHHRLEVLDDAKIRTRPNFGRTHRQSIGTITSDGMVTVKVVGGSRLGSVEERFAASLKSGDTFFFAGRGLRFQRLRDGVLEVRPSKSRSSNVPHYAGGRMPLSSQLSKALRRSIGSVASGTAESPEIQALEPIWKVQLELSALPQPNELLIEMIRTREGVHCVLYPFDGKLVHDGLGALLAFRIARRSPASFSIAANDYGLELLAEDPDQIAVFEDPNPWNDLLNPEKLESDIEQTLNLSEMARRQFREIARVAGLVHEGPPGKLKSSRHVQASSGLIYDVFARFDPENALLKQARNEVLDLHFDRQRLKATLTRLHASRLLIHKLDRPSPLALPIIRDRLSNQLSTESLQTRIQRFQKQMLRS